jgi:hypothetical protein
VWLTGGVRRRVLGPYPEALRVRLGRDGMGDFEECPFRPIRNGDLGVTFGERLSSFAIRGLSPKRSSRGGSCVADPRSQASISGPRRQALCERPGRDSLGGLREQVLCKEYSPGGLAHFVVGYKSNCCRGVGHVVSKEVRVVGPSESLSEVALTC